MAMKALYLATLSIFIFSISACNVYKSDANEFLNENAKEQDGRYVISSDKVINTSSCQLSDSVRPSEGALKLIDSKSNESISYTVYKVISQKQAYVYIGNDNVELLCKYNLKNLDLTIEATEHILDLSFVAIETY